MNKMGMAIIAVIVLVSVAGGAFFAGTKVGEQRVINNPALAFQQRGFAQRGEFPFAQGTPPAGQRGMQAPAGGAQVFGGGMMGTIEAIEGNTLTLSTDDSTIRVLTTETTLIQKSMNVSAAELEIGEQITVSGSQNDDGSVTARSIRSMRGFQFVQSEQQ